MSPVVDPNLADFGARLVRFREAAELTQKQLAAGVSRHVDTVGTWERGENAPNVLDALAPRPARARERRRAHHRG